MSMAHLDLMLNPIFIILIMIMKYIYSGRLNSGYARLKGSSQFDTGAVSVAGDIVVFHYSQILF